MSARIGSAGSGRPPGSRSRARVGWRVAAGTAAAVVALAAAAAEPEVVVARVNGAPVTRAELTRMRESPLTAREVEAQGGGAPDGAALDRLALRKVIQRRLLVLEARRRGLTVAEPELDRAVGALRRKFGDLAAFGAWMQAQGLDDTSLFEVVREDLAAERAWKALQEEVRPTDEEVRRYYRAHERELRREEVRLQIIAVGDEAQAEEILQALREGADFGRLARQRSLGRRAAAGGDTGWIPSATLRSPLLEAVATLKVGMARGPVRRGSELLVIRLHGWRLAPRSLEEARADVERRLLLPAGREEAARAWLGAREAEARVELVGQGPLRLQ